MGAGRSFSLGILCSLHAGVLSESPSQNARNRIQDDCLRLCKLSEKEGGEESGVPAQCSEMQSAPAVSETHHRHPPLPESVTTWGAWSCPHPTEDDRGQRIRPEARHLSAAPPARSHRLKAHLAHESATQEGGLEPPLPYRKSYVRLAETLPQGPDLPPHRV